jgi:Glycosyl hydrolase family 79 C-terminal beta domain
MVCPVLAWVRARYGTLAVVVSFVAVLGLLGTGRSDASSRQVARHATPPRGGTLVTVDPRVSRTTIPAGFLGLSFEYWAESNYAGKNPSAIDPVLVQLIRNLTPNGGAVLRIGGVTTDWTWWPVAGFARPGGVNYTLDTRRLEVMGALARAVGGRLILGLNLEANSPVLVAAEAQAMLKVIGPSRIEAFELGNEPELYSSFPWYHTSNGNGVVGRPAGWDAAVFTRDFAHMAAAIGPVPLAGPTVGALSWLDLAQFLGDEPRLAVVSLHRYPTWGCFNSPASQTYPTIGNLLSESSSSGLAESLVPDVAIAHAHGLPVRNDEMNSVSCGNGNGVANVFASALWVLDALFEMAHDGVDGVNIHTAPTYPDRLFVAKRVKSHWQAMVAPEYYGLLMFAQAAPAGSRLLQVSGASGAVRAWATRDRGGKIRVVLINDDTAHPQKLAVRVPGASGAATLERLQAPSVHATRGVTLGDQSFGAATTTGALPKPNHTVALSPRSGDYVVQMPAASAALLTLPPS